MRRALPLVALLLFASCGGGPSLEEPTDATPLSGGAGPIREIDVDLREVDGSGVTGKAHIETTGDESGDIMIELSGAPSDPLTLHTHSGPCTAEPTEPTHIIDEPIADGRLKTRIDASVQGLTHGGFNLAVHENEDGGSQHIACGEVAPGIRLEE